MAAQKWRQIASRGPTSIGERNSATLRYSAFSIVGSQQAPAAVPTASPEPGAWAPVPSQAAVSGVQFRDASALSSAHVAFDPAAGRERMRAYRSFFVERYFEQPVDFVGRGQIRAASARRGPWLRWYLFGILAGLAAFLDFGERRYMWWGMVLADVQAYVRVVRDLETVYCFGLYDRRPYVLAAYLARHTRTRVVLVYQNIPLYRNCRHLHLRVPVVLTSRVNLPEAEYFRSQGLFKPSEIVYKSQEFVLDFADLEPSAPIVDIGFFSSGEWARMGGLYQSDDAEAIRAGGFADNEYARTSETIAAALAVYAREHGLTLRIYPHPLERRLRNEHGILPPYAALADGQSVTIDESGESSRRKIYEPRVAVSLQSSFIWERLDLGLDASFIYEWGDAEKNPFLREALGPFVDNLFRDADELAAKLDRVFAPESRRTPSRETT